MEGTLNYAWLGKVLMISYTVMLGLKCGYNSWPVHCNSVLFIDSLWNLQVIIVRARPVKETVTKVTKIKSANNHCTYKTVKGTDKKRQLSNLQVIIVRAQPVKGTVKNVANIISANNYSMYVHDQLKGPLQRWQI